MTITLEQMQAAGKAVVEQFGPTHRNPGVDEDGGCWYTSPHGDGHCVAGQIAVVLGLEHTLPSVVDFMNGTDVNEMAASEDYWRGLFTDDAVAWLSNVQFDADNGKAWAEAVGDHT